MTPATASPGTGVARWLAFLGLAGCALVLWSALCSVPGLYWNPPRLAPAYALAAGLDIYATRATAAHLGWHYGPVFPLWSLPAAFVPQITLSFIVWALLHLGALFLSAWFVLRRLGTPGLLSGAIAGVLFIGQAYTQSMLYLVHVDTLCVAFGFASAWLAHGALADARPRLLPWAALCAVLAPWTKQLGVAVPLAVFLWLWWTGRRDLAGRFFFWCVVWGGVTGMLFFAVFGAENLAFNLWLIHARTPFRGGWTLLLPETGRLLLENWVWLAAFAAAWIFPTARVSVPRTSLAALLWFLALAHLPLGISAVLKEGGGWNSLHTQYYLLPLLAGLLVRVAALPRGRLLLAAIFLASFMQAAWLLHRQGTVWTPYRGQEDFLAEARAQAGRVYFPWNPLLTIITERRVYPFDNALFCLTQAGLEPRHETVRATVPPSPLIIYHEPVQGHFALRYFPEKMNPAARPR